MTKTESDLGTKTDSVIQRHRKKYWLTVGFILCVGIAGGVLSLMGHNPFGAGAPAWLKYLFLALLFLPVLNLIVGNMTYADEMDEATAEQYSGPPQSPFVLRVPSRVGHPGRWFTVVPLFVFGATILLTVLLSPVLGDAVIAAGGSFMVFNMALFGVFMVVFGVGVWFARRNSFYNKYRREFTEEFFAALSGTGYSWARSGYHIFPDDYVDDSYVSLKDSAGLTSKWNLTWDGELATLTPMPADEV